MRYKFILYYHITIQFRFTLSYIILMLQFFYLQCTDLLYPCGRGKARSPLDVLACDSLPVGVEMPLNSCEREIY